MTNDTITLTDQAEACVVSAVTSNGDPITLASDPDGDYFVVEQLQFLTGPVRFIAHRIGPGDRVKPGIRRFAALTSAD
jgi:hypothetical protein